jgi:hypothetical protein
MDDECERQSPTTHHRRGTGTPTRRASRQSVRDQMTHSVDIALRHHRRVAHYDCVHDDRHRCGGPDSGSSNWFSSITTVSAGPVPYVANENANKTRHDCCGVVWSTGRPVLCELQGFQCRGRHLGNPVLFSSALEKSAWSSLIVSVDTSFRRRASAPSSRREAGKSCGLRKAASAASGMEGSGTAKTCDPS